MKYPEVGEYAVGRVKKILPYGAVISLEEYDGLEAFVHISEVFSGWVRNIREHAKEGQLLVVKILSVDPFKHQVDASVKRVNESDKKRKLQQIQRGKKAQKMLEATGQKLGKSMTVAIAEVQKPLEEAHGDLYTGLEALAQGACKVKLPKSWQTALEELAKREIRPKIVRLRAVVTLKCFTSGGIEKIKSILSSLQQSGSFKVNYVSAPTYYMDVESTSYKAAEKIVSLASQKLAELAQPPDFEASVTVQTKAA